MKKISTLALALLTLTQQCPAEQTRKDKEVKNLMQAMC